MAATANIPDDARLMSDATPTAMCQHRGGHGDRDRARPLPDADRCGCPAGRCDRGRHQLPARGRAGHPLRPAGPRRLPAARVHRRPRRRVQPGHAARGPDRRVGTLARPDRACPGGDRHPRLQRRVRRGARLARCAAVRLAGGGVRGGRRDGDHHDPPAPGRAPGTCRAGCRTRTARGSQRPRREGGRDLQG